MNRLIRATIALAVLAIAILCIQSCRKKEPTPEENLEQRREQTFSKKERIMSFYLNGKLVCDYETWDRCDGNFSLSDYHVFYNMHENGKRLHIFSNAQDRGWNLDNTDIKIGCITFDIPIDEGKFLVGSTKVNVSFHRGICSLDYVQLSVSSMDFEIVEYDEENKCLMGRFSFNASYNFGGKDDWPESVEFSVTDGMFCAYSQ